MDVTANAWPNDGQAAEGNANACYANVLQSQSLIVVHKLNANETRSMIWEGAGMSNGGLVQFNYHFD